MRDDIYVIPRPASSYCAWSAAPLASSIVGSLIPPPATVPVVNGAPRRHGGALRAQRPAQASTRSDPHPHTPPRPPGSSPSPRAGARTPRRRCRCPRPMPPPLLLMPMPTPRAAAAGTRAIGRHCGWLWSWLVGGGWSNEYSCYWDGGHRTGHHGSVATHPRKGGQKDGRRRSL
jgi:hypothetical protein